MPENTPDASPRRIYEFQKKKPWRSALPNFGGIPEGISEEIPKGKPGATTGGTPEKNFE